MPLCCLEYKHTDISSVGGMKFLEVICQTTVLLFLLSNNLFQKKPSQEMFIIIYNKIICYTL